MGYRGAFLTGFRALSVAVFTATALNLDKVLTAKMCIFYILNRVAFAVTYGLNIDIIRTIVFIFAFFTGLVMMGMSIFPTFDIHTEVDNLLAVLPVKLEL